MKKILIWGLAISNIILSVTVHVGDSASGMCDTPINGTCLGTYANTAAGAGSCQVQDISCSDTQKALAAQGWDSADLGIGVGSVACKANCYCCFSTFPNCFSSNAWQVCNYTPFRLQFALDGDTNTLNPGSFYSCTSVENYCLLCTYKWQLLSKTPSFALNWDLDFGIGRCTGGYVEILELYRNY